MAKKEQKTNAMRMLDQAGIDYEVLSYAYDDKHFDGEMVAQLLDLPSEAVFKTLVTRSERGQVVVCCLPVDQKLDLKQLASAYGCKRLEMIKQDELLAVTGYLRGGCSPIGMKKLYPTFIDQSALLHDRISVSGGLRGLQIYIEPQALVRCIDAQIVAFSD